MSLWRTNFGRITEIYTCNAQIFAGLMYLAASACIWTLRVWKIGQIERIAAKQEKALQEVDIVFTDPSTAAFSSSPRSKLGEVSVINRLFQWIRV